MRYAVSSVEAVSSCLGMAAMYVGVLYCCPREIRVLPRDHPRHILARFFLISIACALFPVYLSYFSDERADKDITFALKLGFHWKVEETTVATLLAVALTMLLFAGSLFSNTLEVYFIKDAEKTTWGGAFKQTQLYRMVVHQPMSALRTIVFGPLTEEFAFRSCMLPLLLDSGWSINGTVFASPLAFGVAHAHHFVDHIRSGKPILTALAIVLFQFLYTTVFGIYASFLFLRTGHFFVAFAVHAYCNIMGFPDLSFLSTDHPLQPFRTAILIVYVGGIVAFSSLLFPLSGMYTSMFWT
ncbi:Aste57867_58 [Aphanomyces stellatus]|uniref:intramembrane prenyl-peptidase Rce1 n=1 Tax=Aphanomyces stellatus TaxID=120398 RepID=A0A485K5S6_9STRA|nr:hypothetical protein As57867_000058 [Aphanomyces stellatus]VFT77284.1 Aste57867_58 [Aphanomyces stellatus]